MNMQRYRQMTSDLDFDAASRAMITGIALGWVQKPEYDGKQFFRGSCVHCDYTVMHTWQRGTPERLIQELVFRQMREMARDKQCLHWRKFVEYFDEGGLHLNGFIAAFDEAGPTLRHATWEERVALQPKSHVGMKQAQLVDLLALAQLKMQSVK